MKNILNSFLILIILFLAAVIYLHYDAYNGGDALHIINETVYKCSAYIDNEKRRLKINYLPIEKTRLQDGRYAVTSSLKENPYAWETEKLNEDELQLKNEMLYVPSVKWKHIKTFPMNTYRCTPYAVTLKDGRVLIWGDEETGYHDYSKDSRLPEIFNPKTKKFKLLNELEFKLPNTFYKLKNGNVLFIDYDKCILFDIKTDTFKKVSEGIGFYKESSVCRFLNYKCNGYAFKIIPYSDSIIYIAVLEKTGRYDLYPKYLKYILKFNLETYKFEAEETADSPDISDAIALNEGKMLLVSQETGDIYIYGALENKFELKSRLLINAKYYLEHLGEEEILFIPEKYYRDEIEPRNTWEYPPFQVLNLKDFSVQLIKTAANYRKTLDQRFGENNWGASKDYVVFNDGSLFNKHTKKYYVPQDRYLYKYNFGNIAALNDNTFLLSGTNSISHSNYSEIIKLEKINEDLYVQRIYPNNTYGRLLKELKQLQNKT